MSTSKRRPRAMRPTVVVKAARCPRCGTSDDRKLDITGTYRPVDGLVVRYITCLVCEAEFRTETS